MMKIEASMGRARALTTAMRALCPLCRTSNPGGAARAARSWVRPAGVSRAIPDRARGDLAGGVPPAQPLWWTLTVPPENPPVPPGNPPAPPGNPPVAGNRPAPGRAQAPLLVVSGVRSEEHTSELQSLAYLVCRLL